MKKAAMIKIAVVCLAIGLISGPVVSAEEDTKEKHSIEMMKNYVEFMCPGSAQLMTQPTLSDRPKQSERHVYADGAAAESG